MIGTIINFFAILLGTAVGLLLRKGIPERLKDTIVQGQGLCVILVGLSPIERGGEDGFLEVLLPAGMTDQQMHDAQLLMSAFHLGIENIAQDYPRYVRLTTRKGK